jgi:hypothetical protein
MHAVVVRVTINDEDSSLQVLREQVVPAVSQRPGFVTGYWMRKDNSGLSIAVFESEAAANDASAGIRDVVPEGVTLDDVEIREVVANA